MRDGGPFDRSRCAAEPQASGQSPDYPVISARTSIHSLVVKPME